ncbi:MAG TPA: hypothetical protein VI603_17980 [Saprospiraceae bacterium]|nr:hypothetical protein [Saprospiraceae bacterium]
MRTKPCWLFLGISILLYTHAIAQNTGINISDPEFLLDIRGTTNDTGAVLNLSSQDVSHFIRFFSGRTGDPYPFIWWREGDPLRFAVGDGVGMFTERMRIRSGGIVGINNMTPVYPLHVNEPSGVPLLSGAPVILGEYTGTNAEDVIGVKGYSRPQDYYGVGGSFEGGWRGIEGKVTPEGSSSYYGVFGEVVGGSGTNVGIYGHAVGTGTNWAGYFGAGNVYVQNNLGIGQSIPEHPLDISSDLGAVRVLSTNHIWGSVLELKNTTPNTEYLGAINFNNSANTYPGQIGYFADHRMTFRTNGAEQLHIKSDGKLGIGSSDPQSWVDIWRNSSFSVPHLTLREAEIDYARMTFKIGLLPSEWSIKALAAPLSADADFLIQYTGDETSGTRLQIKGTGETVIPAGVDASYSSHGYLMLGASGSGNVILDNNEILARNNGAASNLSLQRDGGDLVLCELENGRVHIGTTPGGLPTDPAYLLAIGGKAICEELKVQLQTSWPDYVFSEDYALTPLTTLENKIQLLGHLPGVPSAAEVHAEGIEVGEMQRIMMEKIEELTLYVIELQKENMTVKNQIAALTESSTATINRND